VDGRLFPAMLKWGLLVVAAGVGGVLLYQLVGVMLRQAGHIAYAGPNTPEWSGAVWLIGAAGLEIGILVGLAIATAFHGRRAWLVLRNLTIAMWPFAVYDYLLTFSIS
jgi:hypothetical protein